MRFRTRLLPSVLIVTTCLLVWLTAPAIAQGPFPAQIQAALRAFLQQPHTWTAVQTFSAGIVVTSCTGCGGGGAPADATYLVNAANGSLSNEVVTNLFQDATDTLAMRRTTNPQTFYVYKTFTNSGNYERVGWDLATSALQNRLVSQSAGTGSPREWWFIGDANINLAPAVGQDVTITNAGGQSRWSFPQGGNLNYGPSGEAAISVGTPTVANVGMNSCGTTAATIVGRNVAFKVTVGATAGTQCRVTFSAAFPTNAPSCTATNESTAALVRAQSTTARVDLLGTFTAGDVIAGICVGQ